MSQVSKYQAGKIHPWHESFLKGRIYPTMAGVNNIGRDNQDVSVVIALLETLETQLEVSALSVAGVKDNTVYVRDSETRALYRVQISAERVAE